MYNGVKVIDVHGHMTTPPEFTVHSANLVNQRKFVGGRANFKVSDDRLEESQQHHLEFLNVRDVDYQLISPRPVHMWHWETPPVQHSWCETTNDVIAQIVKLHPDRFGGVAQLPQNYKLNTKDVVPELRRAINDLGFVGAIVNPDPGANGEAPGMDDDYWYPLYEEAAKLGAVLMIHASISRDPRLWNIPQNYQVNNVVGQFLATIALEHSRVWQDFPTLKIFVSHLGGALNRFIMTDESHYFGNKNVPNLAFDTCAHDADFLTAGIRQKTVSRVMFGTEAPGAGSGAKRPDTGRPADDILPVIKSFGWLTEAEKLDIFHNNAKKFFPLANRFPV